MAITELPEKTADSLGLPLVNIRTPQPNQLSAVHVEAIKDNAIQVTTAVGLDDGSTNGSLRREIFQAKGSGSAFAGSVAKVAGVGGALKLLRSGFSVDPPGVDDDSAHGYGIGSTWDQVDSLPPWDGPPARVLWVCKSDYVGAAEWVELKNRGLVVQAFTASGALIPGVQLAHCNTGAGAISITLPDPATCPGFDFGVKKINDDADGITLVPHDTTGSGPSIEQDTPGDNPGASRLLPGSDDATTGYWWLYEYGGNWWFAQ